MASGPTFRVDLHFDLIQSLRLLHALLECDGDVRVHPRDYPKLTKLEEVFGLSVSDEIEGVPVLPEVEVDHDGRPMTRLGRITRPLIFAHGMVERCRSLWARDRSVRACFVGRLHRDRRRVLRQWMHRQFPEVEVELPSQAAVDRRVELRKTVRHCARRLLRGPLRSLRRYVGVPPAERRTTCRNVVFVTSDRGWRHPTKAWDASYFQRLANAKYVLCPDGKFVWTYRFFEAALCGAIPIIQNRCDLYDGFRFYTMDDLLDNLEWRFEDARHNFKLCRERCTVSLDRLNTEIHRLLRRSTARRHAEQRA